MAGCLLRLNHVPVAPAAVIIRAALADVARAGIHSAASASSNLSPSTFSDALDFKLTHAHSS